MMGVHLFHPATDKSRHLVAVHQTSYGTTAYQFTVAHFDDEKVATLNSKAALGTNPDSIPEEVRETLEIDGYTVRTDAATDGGRPSLDDIDIPAAFEDVPHIENPNERQRAHSRLQYPTEAVPDEGPVPDPHHALTPSVTVEIPDWVTASILSRLDLTEDLTEADVHDIGFEYVQVSPVYITSSGHDLIDELVNGEGR